MNILYFLRIFIDLRVKDCCGKVRERNNVQNEVRNKICDKILNKIQKTKFNEYMYDHWRWGGYKCSHSFRSD